MENTIVSTQSAPARKGLIHKWSEKCAAHGRACLTIIIVLSVLVIMMYVYYHGFWKFGPYGAYKIAASPAAKKKSPPKSEKDSDAKPDTETQKLIEDINGG